LRLLKHFLSMIISKIVPEISIQTQKSMTVPLIKIAILDMYQGAPNQGKQNILDILDYQILPMQWDIFDVRGANELPSMDYDIFISTGGPGSPLDGDGVWDRNYFDLIDEIWRWNFRKTRKKYVFFICHSFQMICNHFKLGQLTQRHSRSFGVLPMHKTADGLNDPILKKLPDPFYAADTRDWQIVQPNLDIFEAFGAKILCLEKIRDHIDFERAIMAVRLSKEFFGTQFHPEADPIGMSEHYKDPEVYKRSVEIYGEEKVKSTIAQLSEPSKLALTNRIILPTFLKFSINSLLHL